MLFAQISLFKLVVNPENDRHGRQPSEQDAVNWLFLNHGPYMLNLMSDIAEAQEIYDPPLVMSQGEGYLVFDGNRRVTALKALAGLVEVPPSYEQGLQKIRKRFSPARDFVVGCQVEDRREVVDLTLSRRHNGTDAGRGQLRWDTRAKGYYSERVGGTKHYEIAKAVEDFLLENGYANAQKLKRSTVFRLLNTKARQNQFGIKLGENGALELTKPFEEVFPVLTKVADDVIAGQVTLKDVLNKSGIDKYLSLIFPVLSSTEDNTDHDDYVTAQQPAGQQRRQKIRDTLIPKTVSYKYLWTKPGLGKTEKIWSQLQFSLKLDLNEISVPIVLRALIETVTYICLEDLKEKRPSTLGGAVRQLGHKLMDLNFINDKQNADIARFATDQTSHRCLEALHRSVHSPTMTLSKSDLLAIWDSIEPFLLSSIANYRTPTVLTTSVPS